MALKFIFHSKHSVRCDVVRNYIERPYGDCSDRRYIGEEGKNKKTTKEVLLDAGSELVGGAGFDKAGLKEFVRKPPRSLFKGGVKQARKALGDEIATGTVETAIPTIIDGAVRRESIEVGEPMYEGFEDEETGNFVPSNTPSQTQEK